MRFLPLFVFVLVGSVCPFADARSSKAPVPHATRNAKIVKQFMRKYGIVKVGPHGQIDHCESLYYQHGSDTLENLQFICGAERDAKERAERFPMLHFKCKSEEENTMTVKNCPGTVRQ